MKTGQTSTLQIQQPSLPGFYEVSETFREASGAFADADVDTRGAVYTRSEVVEFILDLVGYTQNKPLHTFRLLEPSFGNGDFLISAVNRLLHAWHKAGQPEPLCALSQCIRAVEIHRSSFNSTLDRIVEILVLAEIDRENAVALAKRWLIQGDFLLVPLTLPFDFVIGNPPYVRQELIPDALMTEYRTRYRTIYDRADLYVPFIERSLASLREKGKLGFICADRWMKNRYGKALRLMVAKHFHLQVYVDMVDTPAFMSDVIAYPAIIVIGREKSGSTRIARQPEICSTALSRLSTQLLAINPPEANGLIYEMKNVTSGSEPWIMDANDQLALVRRLEKLFPMIEDAGCKVGIGVATGADEAYIGPFDNLDVEPSRKLPLITTKDILTGSVQWNGLGVVNPFNDNGGLVDLALYPRLKRYFNDRKEKIAKRHIAQKIPSNWYRTIDRIHSELTRTPKLLIPDIKGTAQIAFDEGNFYPHHNLYFITSEEWDLRALQAVLLSGIARLFVAAYSTKMRGGYLRFQAQYLRRIRLPRWQNVTPELQNELMKAAERKDVMACNRAAFNLYGLSDADVVVLGEGLSDGY